MQSLLDVICTLYFRANRPFLRALAEIFTGNPMDGSMPDGREVLAHVEAFLRQVPRPFYRQVHLLLCLFPIKLPPRIGQRSELATALVRIWFILTSQIVRVRFLMLSRSRQRAWIGTIHDELRMMADEDDLFLSILTFTSIKSLLSGAFMDLPLTWKALGYQPYPNWPPSSDPEKPPTPHPVMPIPPPSGRPDGERPAQTENSRYLLEHTIEVGTPGWHERLQQSIGTRRTYCVIGSGAGGAIVAYYLQQADPESRVLLLETARVTSNEHFPDSVLAASACHFMNAGATVTADRTFTFRQGRTVGGSTTVNNAISLKPEGFWWTDNLIGRWQHAGVSMNWPRLSRAYDEVGTLLGIRPLDPRLITEAARTVRKGFQATGQSSSRIVDVNLGECVGCGRCNLGCQYDAKNSMSTAVIPEFMRRGGILLSNAHAHRLEFSGQPGMAHVTAVQLSPSVDGGITIKADRFILAPGAYASSKLLWESGFTGASDARTVGRKFTCNFGSPVIGRFPSKQRGWAGQQVGYILHIPQERLVLETAFAPPGLLGSLAPQWGAEFMEIARSYNNIAVIAPTVSSYAYGEIRKGNLFNSGYLIDWSMNSEDWRRLAWGMKLAARTLFSAGATDVFSTRFGMARLSSPDDIDRYFDGMGPADNFKVESSHPTGGNVIHPNPRLGVVDEHLKVHGVGNLWITDASVIPASITLNLQFTIMALARYAVPGIVASDGIGHRPPENRA